jgi:hypothetical protein
MSICRKRAFRLSLELKKKQSMFGVVRDVNEHTDQVVPVRLTFVPPEAADRLCLGRHGPEMLFQFEQSVGDKIVWHGLPIIEPERQQDLVSSE